MWLRLGLASAGVVGAVLARALLADPWPWLAFNLGLAWVPVALGAIASRGKRALVLAGPLWLLFLPNAPYLLTDLVHLRSRPPVPLWFDVALLGGAGALGLALGALSLRQMADCVRRVLGPWGSFCLWAGCPPLCGVAIYLGRVSRWNSWDVFRDPTGPLSEVLGLIAAPGANRAAWAFILTWTLLFGAAASLGYRDPRAASC